MFGLTKREQRWAAEQKAAETILGFLGKVVAAEVASDTKAFKDVVTERDDLLERNEQLRNQNTSLDAKDAEMLDWLEQQHWDADELFELVNNWTTQDNKRHPAGLRQAIHYAMASNKGEQSNVLELVRAVIGASLGGDLQ